MTSEDELRAFASSALPNYKFFGGLNEFQFQLALSDHNPAPPVVTPPAWVGIRLQSDDERFIVQWKLNGVVFSQVNGYHDWREYFDEFQKVAQGFFRRVPLFQMERIGLRFINRIELSDPKFQGTAPLLVNPVSALPGLELPTKGFFHQDSFELPQAEFGLNRIVTIQVDPSLGRFLLLDLDAYWEGKRPVSEVAEFLGELNVLRWIKNKVFFATIDTRHWREAEK